MEIGDRVILMTFNNLSQCPPKVIESENYWKLIGKKGKIVKDPREQGKYASFSKKKRLLVHFEDNLKIMNLDAHNNIENSLWILESDLKIIRLKSIERREGERDRSKT